MITINTTSLWPILLALMSGLIGYQFSRRGREKDHFLDELTKSYREVYCPMHISLTRILRCKNKGAQNLLLRDFFSHFSSMSSELKWMADPLLIKNYFGIEESYENLQPQEYDLFIEKLTKFSMSVKTEFNESHDLIYLNHKRSKKIMQANPPKRILLELVVLVYYVTIFFAYLSSIYLFLSIVNIFQREPSSWLSIPLASLFLLFDVAIFSCVFPIHIWYFPKDDLRETKSFWGQFKVFFERL